jgi:uncharacterized protein (DUF362 family)
MGSIVSIVKVRQSVCEAVREAMELAQWRRFISPGADVSLKVNLGWDLFMPGAITSPWVVEGIIQTLREEAGSITVVESDQVLVSCERALRVSYIDRVCRRYNVPFVNMSKGRFQRVTLDDGLALKQFDVPEILLRTEMITVPVIKTHDKTTITGPIKNQWGCLDKLRHNYHLVINEALVDINRVARPRFAVLDATVGMDGNAPKSGRPRIVGRTLASGDIVALEAVMARIMGFDPARIPHILNCAAAGLGVADLAQVDVVGEDYRALNLHFAPAQHNFVSVVELALRKSFLRPLIFDTPIFKLNTAGAIVWYWIWYYLLTGRKLRDAILADPLYGRQWKEETWRTPTI